MTHLEIEYKSLLTKGEFQQLSHLFSHVPPVTQTNYYFDSETFDMRANHMSLRIRTLPNHAELTLKIPKAVGNLEYNQPLELEVAKQMVKSNQLPTKVDFLARIQEAGISLNQLRNYGSLTTVRREMLLDIGLLALDCNYYADVKDYELELEVTNAEQGKEDFERFLAEHQIDFKYAKSKIARFSSTLSQR